MKFVYYAVSFKTLNITQINWDFEVLNSLSDIHKQIIFNNHAVVWKWIIQRSDNCTATPVDKQMADHIKNNKPISL
jgi:hypothetical protein